MSLSETLKAAILNSKQSRYAIARGSKIDHAVLRRFITGERDIKLKTAESLAHYLELELVKKKKKAKKNNGK
jgi:ribosome-binding protein aMBF1 (putative translation factor)